MLKKTIQSHVVEAMKAGNSELSGILRLLVAALSQKEKDKRYAAAKDNPSLSPEELETLSVLSDEEDISVLAAEIKKRKDAIALYEQGGRPELAESEKKEIEIIQKYLPEQIPAEELKKIVEEAVEKTGAKEMKDMGKVMAELNSKIKGRADASEVSKMVKELLVK